MNQATYSPEDNKLRLYVGRVPRAEYEALRAQGWISTPKQGCDFVATWTPGRRDTALQYAEIIEDEDQGPAERAAERAERFSDYRDKRTGEAIGQAEAFDQGPAAHGFQSQAKAERAAARHDLTAARACDAWGKAEYWQRRTAGVISHALHVSSPSVRMGRIKTLEAELRRFAGTGGEWETHLTLRLAYENQMLESQGGRAGVIEMIPGGWLKGGRWMGTDERQIVKVNKSPVSGRVVSVLVRDNRPSFSNHYGNSFPDGVARVLSHTVEVERLNPEAYRAPTAEELAAFEAKEKEAKKARKAAAPDPVPLINPTDADAERLQALWNAAAMASRVEQYKRNGYNWEVTDCTPQTVLRLTQATYSALSKGTYARACTREVFAGGLECGNSYNAAEKMRAQHGREVCQVRRTSGGNYSASRVIILTDKPQKPLPESLWAPAAAQPVSVLTP